MFKAVAITAEMVYDMLKLFNGPGQVTKYSRLPNETKERLRSYAREYYWAHRNKEVKNKKSRQYYADNKEAIRTKQRARAAIPENREKKREQNKRYLLGSVLARRQQLVAQARYRAKVAGLPCTISAKTLHWPAICPALGIAIDYSPKARSTRREASPSIDRIDPRLGYTQDNAIVISWRANRIKNDATAEELELIASFLRNVRQTFPQGTPSLAA